MRQSMKDVYRARASRIDSEPGLLSEKEVAQITSRIISRCVESKYEQRAESRAYSLGALTATACALFVAWYVPTLDLSEEAIITALHTQMFEEIVQMEVL